MVEHSLQIFASEDKAITITCFLTKTLGFHPDVGDF